MGCPVLHCPLQNDLCKSSFLSFILSKSYFYIINIHILLLSFFIIFLSFSITFEQLVLSRLSISPLFSLSIPSLFKSIFIFLKYIVFLILKQDLSYYNTNTVH